jgi:hypothetical protein
MKHIHLTNKIDAAIDPTIIDRINRFSQFNENGNKSLNTCKIWVNSEKKRVNKKMCFC